MLKMDRKHQGQMSLRDKVKKRAEERENQRGSGFRYNLPDNVNFFTPKKGVMNLDILPYRVSVDGHPSAKKGELWFQRTVFCHYSIGVDEKAYLCLKTMHKKCPICDHRAQLAKNNDADQDVVNALKSKERELYNVVNLGDESKGVQLWDISYHLFGTMLEEEIRNGKDEWAGFAELKGGFSLQVRFGEKSLGKNKFLETTRIDFTERDDYPETILNDVLDLDRILNVLEYEQLEKIFFEIEDSETTQTEETSVEEGKKDQIRIHHRTPVTEQKEESVPAVEEKRESSVGRRTRPTPSSASSSLKCPGSGEFGKDVNELEECATCDIWAACDEKAVELEQTRRK